MLRIFMYYTNSAKPVQCRVWFCALASQIYDFTWFCAPTQRGSGCDSTDVMSLPRAAAAPSVLHEESTAVLLKLMHCMLLEVARLCNLGTCLPAESWRGASVLKLVTE
jgi:hypothetical protein